MNYPTCQYALGIATAPEDLAGMTVTCDKRAVLRLAFKMPAGSAGPTISWPEEVYTWDVCADHIEMLRAEVVLDGGIAEWVRRHSNFPGFLFTGKPGILVHESCGGSARAIWGATRLEGVRCRECGAETRLDENDEVVSGGAPA